MDNKLQSKKLELIQWLSMLSDKKTIDRINLIKDEENSNWWQEISENEKESIEKGIIDAENGKLKTHTEARKIYEKWL